MEALVAASTLGKKKFFIDISNWDAVEKQYRPFLINSGWPPGLTPGALDIARYIEEVREIYRDVVEDIGRANREAVRGISRAWFFRFFIPTRLEVNSEAVAEMRRLWEIKTHVEEVLGRRLEGWGQVYLGKVPVEVRGKAVHLGGLPSIGHTYLKLIGVLEL